MSAESEDAPATPLTTLHLFGHGPAERSFLEAWTAGRLHHAWLLTGPRGVGKATLAYRMARFVLSGVGAEAGADGLFGSAAPASLDVDPENHAARLMAAGSHPGLKVLERIQNDKGKLAKEISVDQVRALIPFLGTTPADGGWRVVIVDAADDMNRAAANALLKMLEEPPVRTLFVLVSHAPGRLLPTIRSRCRRLVLAPLEPASVHAALRSVRPDLATAEIERLVPIAQGCPGRALRFAGLDIEGLESALDLLARTGDPDGALALNLAAMLSAAAAQPRYEAFLELVPERLATMAEEADPADLARLVSLWEKARDLAGAAVPLALDPRSVVFELSRIVASASVRTSNLV